MSKDVRLNATHFIIKKPNKKTEINCIESLV